MAITGLQSDLDAQGTDLWGLPLTCSPSASNQPSASLPTDKILVFNARKRWLREQATPIASDQKSSQSQLQCRLHNFVLTSTVGKRQFGTTLWLGTGSGVSYFVTILCSRPLVSIPRSGLTQLTQELAQSLSTASSPVLTVAMITESVSFKQLMRLTSALSAPLDLFGTSNPHLSVPASDFSLTPLLTLLSPGVILQALEALLMEKRVLVSASRYSTLLLACEGLRSLLYPFTWNYLYIPIIPFSLFFSLACPTPWFGGVHSCYLYRAMSYIHGNLDQTVVLDIDNNEIIAGSVFKDRESSRGDEKSGEIRRE